MKGVYSCDDCLYFKCTICQPYDSPKCDNNHTLEFVKLLPDYYDGKYRCDWKDTIFLIKYGVWHCSKCNYDINPGVMPLLVRKTLLRQYHLY
jgi:hypothetical protein